MVGVLLVSPQKNKYTTTGIVSLRYSFKAIYTTKKVPKVIPPGVQVLLIPVGFP